MLVTVADTLAEHDMTMTTAAASSIARMQRPNVFERAEGVRLAVADEAEPSTGR
jgi:hypothetical protein